jgi:hypothetical protein
MIRKGDERWKELVPAEVARIISERGYFGLEKQPQIIPHG